MPAQVHVLYFAGLREQKARTDEWVAIEPGCRAGTLFERLFPDHPGEGIAFAVNRARVVAAHPLADGDELALLPPLGGG
jgi:molybdopterin converting factor small subunit